MTQTALEGGTRLHTLLSLLNAIDDHLLQEVMHATQPGGDDPNPLTYRCAQSFKKFKEEIATITVECQNHPPAQKPGFGSRPASSGSRRQ